MRLWPAKPVGPQTNSKATEVALMRGFLADCAFRMPDDPKAIVDQMQRLMEIADSEPGLDGLSACNLAVHRLQRLTQIFIERREAWPL